MDGTACVAGDLRDHFVRKGQGNAPVPRSDDTGCRDPARVGTGGGQRLFPGLARVPACGQDGLAQQRTRLGIEDNGFGGYGADIDTGYRHTVLLMGAASDAEPLGVAGARPSVRNGQRLFTGVPMSICFWARKKAAPEELFEAGVSGNAEGLTVFDKRVVFPIGERLRADALSFEGPVLGHGRDGRGVACRENEAASKEGSSAEGGKPGKGCPAEGCEHGHFPMLVVYERSERIPEPSTRQRNVYRARDTKKPVCNHTGKAMGECPSGKKGGRGCRYQHTANCDGDIQPHRRRRQVMPEI